MMGLSATRQDTLYQRALVDYTATLKRVTQAYEADPEIRRDLLQEIHVALWRSFADFDERCSTHVDFPCGSQYGGYPCRA